MTTLPIAKVAQQKTTMPITKVAWQKTMLCIPMKVRLKTMPPNAMASWLKTMLQIYMMAQQTTTPGTPTAAKDDDKPLADNIDNECTKGHDDNKYAKGQRQQQVC
jgi:hypothetical protein